MILEIHDNEVGNTLAARVKDIDYDYQAEEWVKEESFRYAQTRKIILLNDDGTERAVWERSEDLNSYTKVSGVHGDWKVGTVWTRELWEQQGYANI